MVKLITSQSTKKTHIKTPIRWHSLPDSTVKYKYKDGIITVNITGVERDYYQKNSNAYKGSPKTILTIK